MAVPLQYPLSRQPTIQFADLKQENMILLERQQSPMVVDYVISQNLQYGFNLKASTYVKDLAEGLTMVALGKGIAFLYSGMNDGTLEQKYQVKVVDLVQPATEQNVIACYQPQGSLLLAALCQQIKQSVIR